MPLYEPVAYYHHHKNYLKGKTEYIDEEDEDDSDVEIYHDDEKRGFVSSNSHYYENALSSRHQRSARLLESSREGKLPILSFQSACCNKLGPIKYVKDFFLPIRKNSPFYKSKLTFLLFKKNKDIFRNFQLEPFIMGECEDKLLVLFLCTF